jgi:hypothetical protein
LGESTSIPARKARNCLRSTGSNGLPTKLPGGDTAELVGAGQVAGARTGRLGQVDLDLHPGEVGQVDGDRIADERRAARDHRAGSPPKVSVRLVPAISWPFASICTIRAAPISSGRGP